jgi:hypothetical protein
MRRLIVLAAILVALTPSIASAETNQQSRVVRGGDGNSDAEIEKHTSGGGNIRRSGYRGAVGTSSVDWQEELIRRTVAIWARGDRPCDSHLDGTPTQESIERTICVPLVNPVDFENPDARQARAFDFLTDYFRRIDIPQPQPEISAKNGGICGVEHTIDMHMQPEMVFREQQTDFGPLDFHVYGAITVDWGDGKKNTYTDGGGPYPYSVIRHAWTHKGFYDITATANWTADFTLGPAPDGTVYQGTLEGIVTQGAINDFRVWDIQAVLTN